MIRIIARLSFFVLLLFIFSGCQSKKKDRNFPDSPVSGTIQISADESFKPAIEAQIRMFENTYPDTKIKASYKSEADCLKDFFKDSATRLVIVTRGLTRSEEKYMTDSIHYNPGWNVIASDAIAVIVPLSSNDTLITMERLRDQLTGKINRNQEIVFDGLNATSTVRFIKDSILKGADFDQTVVKATRNSSDVIDYVANHENAIGLLGISWIGNPEDTAQAALRQKVKLAWVRCNQCADSPFVKPIQESMLTRRYPLVRGLYYIIKENYSGLGTGFISFLKYERGQLIFRRAYLGPVMDFGIRDVQINIKSPKNKGLL
jgi:phosphate transport system substrate-binding protein